MYNKAIEEVSEELNLPYKVVDNAYKSFWRFIRNTIQELPLKENLSIEEFSKLKTNFNIPSLGKLSCTYDRMQKVKERFKVINNLKNKL